MKKKKVLIVDDDRDLCELLRELLTLEGFSVDWVDNGALALAKLKSEPLPAVILLDISMPVMDGMKFREEQLKHTGWAKVPVILMSGAYKLEKAAEGANITHILPKPPNIEQVIAKVRELASLLP